MMRYLFKGTNAKCQMYSANTAYEFVAPAGVTGMCLVGVISHCTHTRLDQTRLGQGNIVELSTQ